MTMFAMPQRRLEAGGWFTRSFSTTSGVLVAVLVFFVGLAVVSTLAIVIAVEALRPVYPSRPLPAAENAVVTIAKSKALPQLRRMGMKSFEGYARTEKEGSTIALYAKSRDELGTLRTLVFEWRVVGDDWELLSYSLDGTKFRRK